MVAAYSDSKRRYTLHEPQVHLALVPSHCAWPQGTLCCAYFGVHHAVHTLGYIMLCILGVVLMLPCARQCKTIQHVSYAKSHSTKWAVPAAAIAT